MRRLLMISPHFPPDSSAGTHRVRLLAPHLRACGWDPVVLTVDSGSYEGRLDPGLATLVPPSLEVVRAHAWPAALTRRFGLGDLGLRALPALRRRAIALCGELDFSAVFITIYPSYPALLGPMLRRRFGLPFVLDYQDPWVGAWGHQVGGGPGGAIDFRSRATRVLAQWLEPRVLRAAAAVVAVSQRTYADAIARSGGGPPIRAEIPIGWDAGDFAPGAPRSAIPAIDLDPACVNLCYVGTILPLGRPPLTALLQAVRHVAGRNPELARRLRLHFVGTSNQSDATDERVMPLARQFGVTDLVREHPARVDYLDALETLRRASGILLLGSTEPHYTPSKAFPALLSERPMLALYHEDSAVVGILRAAAPPPAAHVVTYGRAESWDATLTQRIAGALERVATTSLPVQIDRAALEPWSAPVLAARLASVCDDIAA